MAVPTTPLGSGSVTVATTSPAGATNYTQLLYSQTDAQRIFTAWQARIQPGGTVAQFTAWLAQQVQNIISMHVSLNEQTVVTPPAITSTNS